MTTLPIEFRQPIFNPNGLFKEWHFWGINIGENGACMTEKWKTDFPSITDPKKSQQYTGLKDRNGDKIYFGDIIRDTNGYTAVLVWFYDRLGLACQPDGSGGYCATTEVNERELCTYTVVGNIYEG